MYCLLCIRFEMTPSFKTISVRVFNSIKSILLYFHSDTALKKYSIEAKLSHLK